MIPIIPERTCGDCKACCEGWLSAKIYDTNMYPGKPCHYICETGCSIYEDRPENPCINFKCLWLKNNNVPGWMKPNKCKVILVEREIEGIFYIDATETGAKMDSSVLSWIFMLYVNNQINIAYQIAGGLNWIGSPEFVKAMSKKYQPIIPE
jgi:hypothetical protein